MTEGHLFENPFEKGCSLRGRKRLHKADGSASVHAVFQDSCKFLEVAATLKHTQLSNLDHEMSVTRRANLVLCSPMIQMLRAAILFVFLFLIALVVLPFVVSSFYIDQRGISIPGQVYAKREDVFVHYSAVKRSSEITVEYAKPDRSGVAFFKVPLTPAEYDLMPVGQNVSLHYLRKQDIPDLPLASFLRNAQLLPTARLANKRALSGLDSLLAPKLTTGAGILVAAVILLVIWRLARVPGFLWAVGVCVLVGVSIALLDEFPRPMPMPTAALKRGMGRVKSLEAIDRLFEGNRSRGIDAGQPIEVVGVEFIPEARTEPVLAVDLIDAGSVPGLKEKAPVFVEYESLSPRTAYIRGASRTFVKRNIAGIAVQGVACIVVLAVLLGGAHLLGRGYKRLIGRT